MRFCRHEAAPLPRGLKTPRDIFKEGGAAKRKKGLLSGALRFKLYCLDGLNSQPKQFDECTRIIYNIMKYIKQRGD
ncbi:MAG: hypothetical protein DBY09_04035 [Selenomonadales bacterium]|jgi:hypothetical protein|nr:MAG: hypothetical protein DBY09_04035 [Selenomonadales bacterium]